MKRKGGVARFFNDLSKYLQALVLIIGTKVVSF